MTNKFLLQPYFSFIWSNCQNTPVYTSAVDIWFVNSPVFFCFFLWTHYASHIQDSYWPSSLSVSGRFWSTQSSDRLKARPIPLLTIWPILVPMAVMMPPLTAARVSSTLPITAPITASLAPATDWYTIPTVSDTTWGRKRRLCAVLGEEWWSYYAFST